MRDDRDFLSALLGDGRPLITLSGLCLIFSGLFALFLSATKQFLPHDVEFLGMTPESLCAIHECRIVHFMFHDRVSFGGSLIGIGTFYLWMAEFPLRQRQPWAWWLLAVSSVLGFGSFLAYLGYGYLDSWHGVATLGLLPTFLIGMVRLYPHMPKRGPRCLLTPGVRVPWMSSFGIGRACLLLTALGLTGAGLTIMIVGMTCVFVPQDLTYMGLNPDDLHRINPRLVPLIAHDRAGFGGGVATGGLITLGCLWCGTPSRSLWQAIVIAGVVGFSTAIGVHPLIGYTDLFHLAPAVTGAVLFIVGVALTYKTPK